MSASFVFEIDGVELKLPYNGRGVITLGRDPRCDVPLTGCPGVSALHAELRAVSGSWWVVDRSHKNGVALSSEAQPFDTRPVHGNAPLASSACIVLPASPPRGTSQVFIVVRALPTLGSVDVSDTLMGDLPPLVWITAGGPGPLVFHLRDRVVLAEPPSPRQRALLGALLECGLTRDAAGNATWRALLPGREEALYRTPGSVAKHRSELRTWWASVRACIDELRVDSRYSALVSSGGTSIRLVIPPMSPPAR